MRKKYPRLRNGKFEGAGLPPYVENKDDKEVYFYIPSGFPAVLAIPSFMKSFPPDFKGWCITSLEKFERLKREHNGE